ncbi:MAG: amino acid ABC transporter substrate-binding protein [SAR324 cluster bacterium]|uniref:Amino acid ABC transporter substrate-binding protein n=1 Tax=SAR324 cluster bacterium TaxID=2024889 RepID=A0A2A4T5L3_9DELT|nr:MAG: amino acid ABC transporter substrate-binding protein [SAR324 cluster bacterium]
MKLSQKLLLNAFLVSSLGLVTACDNKEEAAPASTSSSSAAAQVYGLAFSGAMTGPTSDAGLPYSRGIGDYCSYVNDNALLGDDKVDCEIKDDGYKTDVTKRNFEGYLEKGIVAYFNYSTGSTLALKEDFEENKMPVIPASMHADNTKGSKYIFLPIASYSEQALGLAEYVSKHHKGGGTPKIAMFIHPSAFGRGPVNDVKRAIEKGLNVEFIEVVEHGKGLDNTAMLKRLQSKGVQYVISQTVQSPVASMLKDAKRLDLTASSFGEAGKLTFLGAHYTGGDDLIALAGDAAEKFLWVTSFRLASEKSEGSDFIKSLGQKYGRDVKTQESHNYTSGVLVAQIAVEAMVRAKAHGKAVTSATVTEELNGMNGSNAYFANTTVGPVTFDVNDRSGVDTLQLYKATNGTFFSENEPFESEFYKQLK